MRWGHYLNNESAQVFVVLLLFCFCSTVLLSLFDHVTLNLYVWAGLKLKKSPTKGSATKTTTSASRAGVFLKNLCLYHLSKAFS